MPCAKCAIASAVAGTTTSASIACATAMCSMAESMLGSCSSPGENIPVITFSPESAAKVRGTNKFLRRARHHHLHANSMVLQQANDFRGFVSRDAAGHAQSDFHNCLIHSSA